MAIAALSSPFDLSITPYTNSVLKYLNRGLFATVLSIALFAMLAFQPDAVARYVTRPETVIIGFLLLVLAPTAAIVSFTRAWRGPVWVDDIGLIIGLACGVLAVLAAGSLFASLMG